MEVVVYVEGGGDIATQRRTMRLGFDRLFSTWRERAPRNGYSLRFVCCGSRQQAYDDFCAAVRAYSGRVNALLVDSEAPIAQPTDDAQKDAEARRRHLAARDGWNLEGVNAERIHLMVQCMEAWIVADPEALSAFYGQYFKASALPARQSLEQEPKRDIYDKLAKATGDRRITQGPYGKIGHASRLLQRIEPAKVAVRCPHFATFTRWLDATIASA